MEKIDVKIVNRGPHELPQYGTALSAGMDLRAWLEEPLTLQPLQRALVHTGIYIALPEGYECQIRPRSGLALKRGLTVLNTPGTIDADYRGEIGVIMVNLSDEPQTIEDGERMPDGGGTPQRCGVDAGPGPRRDGARRGRLRPHGNEIVRN